MKRRTRSSWLALPLLVGTAPLLLGADGCIEDLTVGIEETPIVDLDAGAPVEDAQVPPGMCELCPGPAPEVNPCADGSLPVPSCERDLSGDCSWVVTGCPDIEDAGVSTCDGGECQGPVIWLVPASPLESFSACPDSDSCDAANDCIFECTEQPPCELLDGATTCPETEHCALDTSTCTPDGGGSCAPNSEACTNIFASLCHCENVTYGKSCEAYRSRVSSAYEATCVEVPSL